MKLHWRRKKQRDDAANELVKFQVREIEQFKLVQDKRENVGMTKTATSVAKDLHKKSRDEHLDKRAAHAKTMVVTKTAEQQVNVIRQNTII